MGEKGYSRRAKLALLALVGVVLLVSWRLGFFQLFADPERMRETLLGLGPWGYLAFLLAFAVLQAFGLPMVAFVIGASYVWPRPIAFALSVVGVMLSATLAFYFARFLGHDWVKARLPPKLASIDEKIARHATMTVIVVRLIFWGNPLTHMLFGVSRITFRSYFFGSVVAYVPVLALVVWSSSYAIAYLEKNPVRDWLPWAIGLVVLVVGARVVAVIRKRRRDA